MMGMLVCLSVCLSVVCLCLSIWNYTSSLHNLIYNNKPFIGFWQPMSVARSSSGGVATRCVLPVLWMTSCLHIMARNTRGERTYTQSDSTGGSTNLTLRRILKLTHQRATPDRWYLLCSRVVQSVHSTRAFIFNMQVFGIGKLVS